jgi:hypothetical protein
MAIAGESERGAAVTTHMPIAIGWMMKEMRGVIRVDFMLAVFDSGQTSCS